MNALCEMTGLNRAGFYRWRRPRQATPVEMELRDQMQKVALEIASLWLSENHLRITTTWLCGQPQARFADDARGQPALRSTPPLRGHDRLASLPAHLSEPGTPDKTHTHQPAVGGRHHVYPFAHRVSFTWLWCWTHSRGT